MSKKSSKPAKAKAIKKEEPVKLITPTDPTMVLVLDGLPAPTPAPPISKKSSKLKKDVESFLSGISDHIKKDMHGYISGGNTSSNFHAGMSQHVKNVHNSAMELLSIVSSHSSDADDVRGIAIEILEA